MAEMVFTRTVDVGLSDEMGFNAVFATGALDREKSIVYPTAFQAGQPVRLMRNHDAQGTVYGVGQVEVTPQEARLVGSFIDNTAGREAFAEMKALAPLGLARVSVGMNRAASTWRTKQGTYHAGNLISNERMTPEEIESGANYAVVRSELIELSMVPPHLASVPGANMMVRSVTETECATLRARLKIAANL